MESLEARLKARKKFKKDKDSEAVEILKEAIEKYPKQPEAYIELGKYYMEKKKWKKASDVLYKAVERDAADAIIYGDLGICSAQLGDLEVAIASQKKALKLDQGNTTLISNIVKLLFNSGELTEARRFLDKAQEEYPHKMELYETENWLNTSEIRIAMENEDQQNPIDS